jgi:hypothetical protein
MNGRKTALWVCAAAASLLSMSVEAASGQDGLEACVGALATELSSARGSAVQARISEDSKVSARRLGEVTIYHLDARDSGGSDVVARMECVVDSHGRVKRLVKLPIDAPDAAARSL